MEDLRMGHLNLHFPTAIITALFGLFSLGFCIAQDPLVISDESKEDPAPEKSETSEAAPPAAETVAPASGKLEITRRTIQNFLTDPIALIPYSGDGPEPSPLVSTFVIKGEGLPYSIIWDPAACRLLGIYKTPAEPDPAAEPDPDSPPPSPYLILAEGAAPFASTMGTTGSPEYFGFRIVEGKPEFLFQHGRVLVEERIWLDPTANQLMQRFTVINQSGDVAMKFPESWKKRISTEDGEWKDTVLSIPEGKENEGGEVKTTFTLAYSLEDNS